MSLDLMTGTELMAENSYGAHLLVDFKPIDAADKLLQECQVFMQQAQTDLFTIPLPTFALKVTGVRSWRTRQRDTKLMAMYSSLVPRIIEAEKVLRNIIGEVVEKKNALRVQAKYLNVRLATCLQHNKSLLDASETPVVDLRSHVDDLCNESAMLKAMLLFNKEVLRIRKLEANHRDKQSFMRWGQKPPSSSRKAFTDAELADDPDHTVIEARLELIRQVQVKFMTALTALLEKRSVEQCNFENCERSIHAIALLTNRAGVMGGETTSAEDATISFDHSRCSDCSYGYSITSDCTNHMITLQKQGHEANNRLRELVVMREKMAEVSLQFVGANSTSADYIESIANSGSPPIKDNKLQQSTTNNDKQLHGNNSNNSNGNLNNEIHHSNGNGHENGHMNFNKNNGLHSFNNVEFKHSSDEDNTYEHINNSDLTQPIILIGNSDNTIYNDIGLSTEES